MKPKFIIKAAAVALLVSATTGCNIYKKYSLPTEGSDLAAEYAAALDAEIDSAAFGNLPWEEVFTDPVLADLIRQALANNKDLANAKLNVDVAHANMLGARLSYLPSLALTPNGAGASYAGSKMSWTYSIPLAASWEIDVFGKILNTKRGASESYRQMQDYEQAVRSQIIGGVANCYYAIAAIEAQLRLSRATAESWASSVQVMKNLKEAGQVNEAAVVQSTAQYYSILAAITDLETSLVEANNTMSLLLNVLPQNWQISPDAVAMDAPAIVRESIPMRELAARPDVRAAERNVAVAYYATNSARAAFYPGLSISAQGGFTNLLGSFIKNPGDWFVQLAGSLTAPLFSRGQNIARLKASKAQQEQAMNDFEYALLSASAEVRYAMSLIDNSGEKYDLLAVQVENLEKSVEYTELLLQLGTSTYLEVLTAQQGLLGAQQSMIACQLTRDQAIINLYQSLGGGR